ncbi:response regulator [Piscinibacter sp. XHJ-5]|uniref:response regulator n=1 Tax=Piscinibacter sp. XHJ-5 TaxID=3037797 RepID=UPI002452EF10|nr:response regulator [Piscinibacter sp. XHJ-5]
MAVRPSEQYTVALQGFSTFERGALASFLRLAAQRTPSYVQVDRLDRCDFVIADADHARSVQAVQAAGRLSDTVFVGAQSPHGAMAWLKRPVDPMQILRELDSLVEQRHSSPGELEAAREPVGAPRNMPALGRLDVAGDGSRRDVLVVEDSAIARRFLQVRLQKLGYRVHLAAEGKEALELLRRERFALVFLDVGLGPAGSLDGLAVCQQLKQDVVFARQGVPKVVIVTGLSGETDRVRGSLAGCDAYLTKPLTEPQLHDTLRTLDPGFAAREKSLAPPAP